MSRTNATVADKALLSIVKSDDDRRVVKLQRARSRGARLFVTRRWLLVLWRWRLLPTSGRVGSGIALSAHDARAAARRALAPLSQTAPSTQPVLIAGLRDHPNMGWIRTVFHLAVAVLCLAGAAHLLTHP